MSTGHAVDIADGNPRKEQTNACEQHKHRSFASPSQCGAAMG
eukprot:CAMPEP_0198454572 /NCGR_PEP_ID=MMETSP1453-20131121/14174_1 /TAXON_ID=1461543 ORGANISM="Unidentified sp., Strain RCC701" /NCGR_SAMPLE_ID=MMETSP1453 /ASSEMBLY_ACC=CAM_ASM_001118 /LENGTH=41 /DNA_ID= /DNA_START= /DNA_END= /DNA_ORIENTATION=